MKPAFFTLRRSLITATVLLALVGLYRIARPPAKSQSGVVVTVRRGPLSITVLNGGSMEALESQEIRSEVRGEPVKILKLVDEGYTVTDEDVRQKKILVELDAAKLKQQLVNQDITFQSTLSQLTEAQQAYEIQLNQNKVDIKSAEQDAKFAFMDLEKYLGDRITKELVQRLDLREQTDTNALVAAVAGDVLPGTNAPIAADLATPVAIVLNATARTPTNGVDFGQYARADLLGDGAAKQELRKREDEVLVSKTELSQTRTKLEGTQRLFEKGFVTKTELENDQISADKARLKLESTETARDLFIKYEFPKQAEELLSKYDKSLRSLERARKEAVSKLAQKRASLKAAEGRYQLERDNRNELISIIDKCTIPATKAGLVVYGGSGENYYWGGRDPIQVGAQVYERQAILTIPDTSKMGVKLSIHESHIKKISKGLRARIKADAFPDDPLEGEVIKVGVLPDSRNRWMNPDMKVYQCTIRIDGSRPWLKPGMSAKVEILVKELPDVIQAPMQAVTTRDGKTVVFLADAAKTPRPVEIGEFNDEFIEIRSGLQPGDKIMLHTPAATGGSDAKEPAAAGTKSKENAAGNSTPNRAATPSPSK